MMASPMATVRGSSVAQRSCSFRCSSREVPVRPRFSKGSSSRSSMDTGVRSSGSSKTAEVRSKGSSSARSPSTEVVSFDTGSAGGGSDGISVTPGSEGACASASTSCVSCCTSSRSGLSSSSFRTTCSSSSVDSCSSWIACCRSGVITTRWVCRRERRMARARTSRRGRSRGPGGCSPARWPCPKRGSCRCGGCTRGP